MSLVIEEHTEARLITEATDTFAVPVDLRYDATSDPRTVHVAFPGGTDWAFGRDLLEGGMRSPAGRGPIRIWPCGRAQRSWRSIRQTASRWCSSTTRR